MLQDSLRLTVETANHQFLWTETENSRHLRIFEPFFPIPEFSFCLPHSSPFSTSLPTSLKAYIQKDQLQQHHKIHSESHVTPNQLSVLFHPGNWDQANALLLQ